MKFVGWSTEDENNVSHLRIEGFDDLSACGYGGPMSAPTELAATDRPKCRRCEQIEARGKVGWVIDKDHFADPGTEPGTCENAVGVMGPRLYQGDGSELKHRFRMLTDDREVVYEGRCSSCDDEDALRPLDDFGMPNFGCTTIQYWVAGKGGGWKNLN
jgi:hypothetical protein